MTDVFVNEVVIEAVPDIDPREPGAVVTTELCGHWEHEPPCTWPHHTSAEIAGDKVRVRTVFVSSTADRDHITERINQSLGSTDKWRVVRSGLSAPTDSERKLGKRLNS